MYGQLHHFGSILSPSLYFFVILANYSLYYVNIHNLSLEKNLNPFGREDGQIDDKEWMIKNWMDEWIDK